MSNNNDSWNQGWSGQAPGAGTNWDSYGAGKSVHDQTQAELSRQNDAWNQPGSIFTPTVDYPSSSPAVSGASTSTSDPRLLHRAPRKSLFLGIVLTVIGGPLGLFYVSNTAALVMLAVVAAGAVVSGGGQGAFVWELGALASVVWSVVKVNAFNRKADALDAAALVSPR